MGSNNNSETGKLLHNSLESEIISYLPRNVV